jgi:predicted esterase
MFQSDRSMSGTWTDNLGQSGTWAALPTPTLWLGNDMSGDVFATDLSGHPVTDLGNLPRTGIAFDGTYLYFGDRGGNIEQRTSDGQLVLKSFNIPISGCCAEDLAWDTKRQRLWRIDHGDVLHEIDINTGTNDRSFLLPTTDPAGILTPLGGLGIAYDPGRDLLYVSFCQQGCVLNGQGLVETVDPSTGNVTGVLFRSTVGLTAGIGYEADDDSLWIGDVGVVHHFSRSGAVLSSFNRPQPGGPVDGLEFIAATPTRCSLAMGPTITNVAVANGAVTVSWQPPATAGTCAITSYVVTATPTANNRLPAPSAVSVFSSSLPPSYTSAQLKGLIADCHQAYSISVTPMMGNVPGPAGTWSPWVRPSGIVQPGDPPYVVILLDGIGESKKGFISNPYAPNDLLQDGVPSYCPEAFRPPYGVFGAPSWPETSFVQPPSGPGQFFEKWNFYDPSDTANGNNPAVNSNSTPRAFDTQGTLTNAFMLDAIAARGAIILPYSYMGAYLTGPSEFVFNPYTRCNSTPGPGGFGCNDLGINTGNESRSLDQDVAMLDREVADVQVVWHSSRIVIVGHSQGGLIAWLWWKAHPSVGAVTRLFSLDAPINGAVAQVPPLNSSSPVAVSVEIDSPLPPGYPKFSNRISYDGAWRALDDKYSTVNDGGTLKPDPFRFIGTWGDSPRVHLCLGILTQLGCLGRDLGTVYSYGGPYSDDTLQHQLLVSGSRCNNQGTIADCPPPADHVSECSIDASSPAWVRDNSHFIVKFCRQDVDYFDNVLGLKY